MLGKPSTNCQLSCIPALFWLVFVCLFIFVFETGIFVANARLELILFLGYTQIHVNPSASAA